ncbi:MAG: type IA DNA topoisomerase, partial [Lachnospiraceae bacterium]|nr:type IA DNA topoisomerase [Lachnospiraceae bacterium]
TEEKIAAEWKAAQGSKYHNSPLLYKENGFKKREDAEKLIEELDGKQAAVESVERSTSKKKPPLLFNITELSAECAKRFKITPNSTLQIAQDLYEQKFTTYPRTDARVLTTAVAKEIYKNLNGLKSYEPTVKFTEKILNGKLYAGLEKTQYVKDADVTDHYAIIPTGQGIAALKGLSPLAQQVYELIARRFLAVFYPPAIYEKLSLTIAVSNQSNEKIERFYTNLRSLIQTGFLHVLTRPGQRTPGGTEAENEAEDDKVSDEILFSSVRKLRKGSSVLLQSLDMKESETTPPKRYNSGTLILTMENAGQFIEDEELRSRIKGAGIGTSATRAEILKKLVINRYLQLNKKTQIITPTLLGEMIYEAVLCSMKPMLSPSLTASWEKGLAGVASGEIGEAEYMEKLDAFIRRCVNAVKAQDHTGVLRARFDAIAPFYRDQKAQGRTKRQTRKRSSGSGKETEGNDAGDRSGTV